MIGFGILALSEGQDGNGNSRVPVWIASMLFALQYGFGDTMAYISIRFIVGVSHSGIGYGIYGVVGNLIAMLVPMIGGFIIECEQGMDKVLWYFCGLMATGGLCWVGVWLWKVRDHCWNYLRRRSSKPMMKI